MWNININYYSIFRMCQICMASIDQLDSRSLQMKLHSLKSFSVNQQKTNLLTIKPNLVVFYLTSCIFHLASRNFLSRISYFFYRASRIYLQNFFFSFQVTSRMSLTGFHRNVIMSCMSDFQSMWKFVLDTPCAGFTPRSRGYV